MKIQTRFIKANNTVHRPKKKTNHLPLIPQKKKPIKKD